MRRQEIEIWALKALDRLTNAGGDEDQNIEFKREWKGLKARQLAGAANAAHGEPILWIVGVDEDRREVVGADMAEKANIWPAIAKEFDEGIAPDPHDVELSSGDKRVCAIQFDTDRAPYVIRGDRKEVPWRSMTGTRSATRSELLLMLARTIRLPSIEVLSARILTISPPVNCRLVAEVYVMPGTAEPVCVPFHDAWMRFSCGNGPWVNLPDFSITQDIGPSAQVRVSSTDAVFSGPASALWSGNFLFAHDHATGGDIVVPGAPIEIRSVSRVVGSPSPLSFSVTLFPTSQRLPQGVVGRWHRRRPERPGYRNGFFNMIEPRLPPATDP